MKHLTKTAMVALIAFTPFKTMAQGIPTFDASTVVQLQQQLAQLNKQYQALKEQHEAITGTYGRGQIELSKSIESASLVPGSWQEIVSKQEQGVYSQTQNRYKELLNTLPSELFRQPNSDRSKTYKLSSESVVAALSGGELLYTQVHTHLNTLATLSQQIDATTNLKDAQDLQNRIATENGLMQSALGKLQVMNLNLQANMLNKKNQATSRNEKYYRWE